MNTTITLPKDLFENITKYATEHKLSPEEFVVEFLRTQFLPQHPYIEIIKGAGSPRPVIKGTRTGVDSIVGYNQAGYSPQEIADDILPHLNLVEINDALSYYEDYQDDIDKMIAANAPGAWRDRLIQEMGEDQAKELLGEA